MELPEILDVVLQYLKVLVWPGVVLTLVLAFRAQIKGVLGRLHKASGLGMNFELNRELEDDARELAETPLPDLKEPSAEVADVKEAAPTDTVQKPTAAAPKAKKPTAAGPEKPAPKLETIAPITTLNWSGYDHQLPRARIESYTPVLNPGRWVVDSSSVGSSPWNSMHYGRILTAWSHLELIASRVAEVRGISNSGTVTDIARQLHKEELISFETVKVASELQALYDRIKHQMFGWSWLTTQTAEDFEDTARRLGSIFEQVLKKPQDGNSSHSE